MSPEVNSQAEIYQYNFTCRNFGIHQIRMDLHLHSHPDTHTHRHTHRVIEIFLMRASLASLQLLIGSNPAAAKRIRCMSFKWLKRHVTSEQYKSQGATEVAIPHHPSLPRDTPSPAVEPVQDLSQHLLTGVRTTVALQVSFRTTGPTFPERIMGQ